MGIDKERNVNNKKCITLTNFNWVLLKAPISASFFVSFFFLFILPLKPTDKFQFFFCIKRKFESEELERRLK